MFSDGVEYLLKLFPPIYRNVNFVVWMLIWPATMLVLDSSFHGIYLQTQRGKLQPFAEGDLPGSSWTSQTGACCHLWQCWPSPERRVEQDPQQELQCFSKEGSHCWWQLLPTCEIMDSKAKAIPPSICIYHIKRNVRNYDCLRPLLQVTYASNLFSLL